MSWTRLELGARTLLGAPGLTTRSKDATRSKGIATRSKKVLGAPSFLFRFQVGRTWCTSEMAGEPAWQLVELPGMQRGLRSAFPSKRGSAYRSELGGTARSPLAITDLAIHPCLDSEPFRVRVQFHPLQVPIQSRFFAMFQTSR